jgi:thymidylate synthase
MDVIRSTNVNEAYLKGLHLIATKGVLEKSRAGDVLVVPNPVVTQYNYPMERVLFDVTRDANPWFHLMEALWMLMGRNDATWLDRFVKDYSKRFAEDDGTQWGAYGQRWRSHFLSTSMESYEEGPIDPLFDQLSEVVRLLHKNPNDRRVVLQMWDPEYDLGKNTKDVPCNLCVLPRVVNKKLDITVFCRSNDAIWGAYGSNAVHFSILQEYLAARLGVGIGTYYQISNNFHAYKNVFEAKTKHLIIDPAGPTGPAPTPIGKSEFVVAPAWYRPADTLQCPYYFHTAKPTPIVTAGDTFDDDLIQFFSGDHPPIKYYHNSFFSEIAIPMYYSFKAWRDKDLTGALQWLTRMPEPNGDWRLACQQWYDRRRYAGTKVQS